MNSKKSSVLSSLALVAVLAASSLAAPGGGIVNPGGVVNPGGGVVDPSTPSSRALDRATNAFGSVESEARERMVGVYNAARSEMQNADAAGVSNQQIKRIAKQAERTMKKIAKQAAKELKRIQKDAAAEIERLGGTDSELFNLQTRFTDKLNELNGRLTNLTYGIHQFADNYTSN